MYYMENNRPKQHEFYELKALRLTILYQEFVWAASAQYDITGNMHLSMIYLRESK